MAKTIRVAFIMAFLIVRLCKVKVNLFKPPNFLLFFSFNVCKSAKGFLLVLYRQIVEFTCLCSCFLNCDARKQSCMVCGISFVFRGAFLSKYCFLYIEIGSFSKKSAFLSKKTKSFVSKNEVSAPLTLRFLGIKRRFPSSNTAFYFLQSPRFLQVLGK